MPKILMPNDILNDTPADAAPVEQNFNGIETHINSNVIERGGSVAMAAQLKLVGDPISPLDAAPKQYIDALLPIGIVWMYGGIGAPPGGRWAECNGAELESSAYPDLYAVLGTRFSPPGTPAGRFNLPPLTGRAPVGAGVGYAAGTTGGQANAPIVNHTHPVPGHAHGMGNHYHGVNGNTGGESTDHAHGVSIQSGGQSSQHYHNGPGGTASLLASRSDQGHGMYGAWTGGIAPAYYSTTDWNAQDHSHAVNGATGGRNVGHVHGVSINTGGPSTNTTDSTALTAATPTDGVDAANANMPPYVVMTYVIRIA